MGMVGCATVDTKSAQKEAETLAALVDKAAQFKVSTLVFKGFYAGMPEEDARKICAIYKLPGKAAAFSPDGKLTGLHLNSGQIKQLFSLNEINPPEFVGRFAQEYKTPAPEYLPGEEEVFAGKIGRKNRWKITDGKSYELTFESSPGDSAFLGLGETAGIFTLTLKRASGSFD
jgi:hypothetical protein